MRVVLREMSDKQLGMTCVLAADGRLAGVITDGDLRRRLVSEDRLVERTAGDVMTTSPKTIAPSALAVQALHIMEAQRITSLAVVDDDERVQGVVHLHDLWRTELF
jgi:arabinose-5-phosphate isomerase